MIKIIEHKFWNTKKVYSYGHLQITYGHCPKRILFKSKMVNDDNQHLCGGWIYFDDDNQEIWKRIRQGLKPFGHIVFWSEQRDFALGMFKEMKKQKSRFHLQWIEKGKRIEISIAVKGKMKDVFDLDSLVKDYASSGIFIEKEVKSIANKQLKRFFADWDNREWLTGLILGYPIENTISLMRGCVK